MVQYKVATQVIRIDQVGDQTIETKLFGVGGVAEGVNLQGALPHIGRVINDQYEQIQELAGNEFIEDGLPPEPEGEYIVVDADLDPPQIAPSGPPPIAPAEPVDHGPLTSCARCRAPLPPNDGGGTIRCQDCGYPNSHMVV